LSPAWNYRTQFGRKRRGTLAALNASGTTTGGVVVE
jgi:hypothetical protein